MRKHKHNPTRRPRLTLRDKSFVKLVVSAQELTEARCVYACKSPEERRAAANWAYDSGMAHELFSSALLSTTGDAGLDSGFESGVVALAIDPRFAPALLTVGSIEYQYKRPDAAMEHFMTLTTLPPTEPDLAEIIDKAGCFLLDQDDGKNAARLYRAATQSYPNVGAHWSDLSYCLGKSGEMEEAVAAARKALALHEDDPYVLNDLGWTLVLAGHHEEARTVLERAVALAPGDYELPRKNLQELDTRMSATRRANRRQA